MRELRGNSSKQRFEASRRHCLPTKKKAKIKLDNVCEIPPALQHLEQNKPASVFRCLIQSKQFLLNPEHNYQTNIQAEPEVKASA